MESPRSRLAVAAALLLVPLLAAAGRDAHGAPEAPRVALRTLGQERVEGTLVSLDEKSLSLRDAAAGTPRGYPLGEIIELRLPTAPVRGSGELCFRAYLVGGELLIGRLVASTEGGVVLDVAGLGKVPLLFEQILTLEAYPEGAGICHDLVGKHPRPETGDVAYDARSDEYRGLVLAASKDELVLESSRGRKQRLAWSKLQVVHLENEALEPARGLRAEVELANGSRLAVSKLGLADGGLHLTLRSLPKQAWTAPFDAVRVVRWRGGRFDYASDLPFESELKPYHPEPESIYPTHVREDWWGARVDHRTSGRASNCPLRLGGRRYRHGFGVNSHSILTVPLAGGYESFRVVFGIDDSVVEQVGASERRGNVDARILGDGKVLWEAQGVRGGDKPRQVGPLDVRGVKTLVLEVGFGKELYGLDRGDWCEPILVKKGE